MRAVAWFVLGLAAFVAMTRIHVIVDTVQMWRIRRQQRRDHPSRVEDRNRMMQIPFAVHLPMDRLLHYWGPVALIAIVVFGCLLVRWILTRPDDPT